MMFFGFGLRRQGLTLIELLVVCLIISILIALLLPAVQLARSAARRVTCSNRLRQHVLALRHYHDTHDQYPAGLYGSWGQSWHAAVLPYLDEASLADTINWNDRGWWGGPDSNSESLRQLATIVLPAKQCPSQLTQPRETRSINGIVGRAISSFNANAGSDVTSTDNLSSSELDMSRANGPFLFRDMNGNRQRIIRDASIIDGLSQSVFLGEVQYRVDPICEVCDRFYHYHPSIDDRRGWDMSEALSSMAVRPNPKPDEKDIVKELAFGSFHPQGLNVSFGDGSVRFVADDLEMAVWRAWGSIAKGDL